MKKRAWKSTFFNLMSKGYKAARRIGPVEPDMMPIALLGLTAAKAGKRPFFYVTASQSRAEQCRDDLTAWAEVAGKKLSVHALPDGSTRRQSLLQADSPRAEALHRLLLEPPDVFFGSVTSLNSPAPVPRLMRESELVLKVGDEVDVKITELDFERRRVSLSIRALLEEAAAAEAAAPVAPAADPRPAADEDPFDSIFRIFNSK